MAGKPGPVSFLVGNGTDGVYDRVEYKYNRQGERIELKDQNGTIHQYEYDALGRSTDDKVTTLGTGVDGTVRRISRAYEVRGMPENITSYDAATAGNAVNDVELDYNDLGMLSKEYQEHEGAQDANTLYTGYNYDDTAAAGEFTKGMRPNSLRYPNGRLVHYTYGNSGSAADVLGRLDAIKDDNGGSPGDTLAAYSWLGLGTMVIEDFQQPDVRLDYYGGSVGTYAGFDRFGRVVQQLRGKGDRYIYWHGLAVVAHSVCASALESQPDSPINVPVPFFRTRNRGLRWPRVPAFPRRFRNADVRNILSKWLRQDSCQHFHAVSGMPTRIKAFK